MTSGSGAAGAGAGTEGPEGGSPGPGGAAGGAPGPPGGGAGELFWLGILESGAGAGAASVLRKGIESNLASSRASIISSF